jgi:hypothetical protein
MEYPYYTTGLSLPELAVVTLYTAIFRPITLNENGIEYLYASLGKHAYVRSMAVVGCSFAFCLIIV